MKLLKIYFSIILLFCNYNSIAQIFEPERVLSRPYIEFPQKVITTDLDNDGLLDVVVASTPPENICWFKNSGNGVFGDKQIVYTAPPASTEFPAPITYSILSKDVDQDGDEDLIAYDCLFFPNLLFVQTILQQCYWIENLGAGNFGEKHIINVDTSVLADYNRNFYLADFDGDGLEDLIYGRNSTWNKFLGNGNWGAAESIVYNNQPFSGDYFLEDINQDGFLDILYNSFNGFAAGLNNGNTQIDTIIQFTDDNFLVINDLAYSDLDQDGLKDLIVCKKIGGDCYFYLLKNLDNNQFSDTIPIYQQTFGSDGIGELEAADFNNDGLIDLVLFTDRICLFLGIGNAQFSPPTFYCEIGFKIISADVNNDSLIDIIGLENELGSYSSITLKKFGLTSLFYNTESICLDDISYIPNVTDIDFDGDLDIYFKMGWYECLNTNPIEYSRFKFVTKGLFSNHRKSIVGIYDFNNDGLKDFIIQRTGNDSLTVLLNNLSGIYTDVLYFPLPLNITIKRFFEFDFNQDDLLDFVIFGNSNSANGINASVLFYKRNELGVIELTDIQNTDLSTLDVDSRFTKNYDINVDGLPDLLHSSENGLACFINLNNGDFDVPYFLTNESTYNFFIEDLNNDDLPDLIYKSQDSIRIKTGIGNAQFSEFNNFFISNLFGYNFTINDFDLDGDPDIIQFGYIPLDTTFSPGVVWGLYYKENDNGLFLSDLLIISDPYVNRSLAADLDGDLDFDLIFSSRNWTKSFFVNRTNKVTGNQNNVADANILVYPNPIINNLYIKFNENQESVDVQIFTIEGKLLKSSNFKNIESTQISLELNAGMYLVRVKTNKEIITKKIIKN